MGVISPQNFMFSSQFEERGVWSTNITDRIRLAKGSSEFSGWVEDEDTEIFKENPKPKRKPNLEEGPVPDLIMRTSSWKCMNRTKVLVLLQWASLQKAEWRHYCPGRRRTRLLQGQISPLELPKWFAAVCVAFCQMHGRIFALPFSAGPALPSATLMYQNSKQLPPYTVE